MSAARPERFVLRSLLRSFLVLVAFAASLRILGSLAISVFEVGSVEAVLLGIIGVPAILLVATIVIVRARLAELVFSVSVASFFAGCGCVVVGLGGFVVERAHGVAVDPALSNYEALHTLGGACICIGACLWGAACAARVLRG